MTTTLHTSRLAERVMTLDSCFQINIMDKAWQNYVKTGMRNQALLDLHDYYDFHRHRKKLFSRIRDQILEGSYRPKAPLVIRQEKKYGVCRHLQIPTTEDAVVLQTIVENIAPFIEKAKPSNRAFYSRSHGKLKSEADLDESFPYAWWELWPEFQKRIYEFTNTFNYIVVTDISNYFDNICFKQLRNVLSSLGRFDEALLDFLFYMLESFVWRPDYLPLSGIGLPQINFDAPRLLSFAFIFEIDEYLKKRTSDNFVRWMDDIDFGVQHLSEAKEILRNLDELLLTRGLRLNMGKTKILNQKEAKKYFYPDENRWLTIMTQRVKRLIASGLSINNEIILIRKRFRRFYKKPAIGRWDKILARFFTISSLTRDTFLEGIVDDLLESTPSIRQQVLRYYMELGPSKSRWKHLSSFYLGKHCSDDNAIFSTAKVFIEWKVSSGSSYRTEIANLAISQAHRSEAHLVTSIWMLAKYGSSVQLANLLSKHIKMWKHSNFLSRQVASVIPRLRSVSGVMKLVERTLTEAGQLDALRIIEHLNELRALQPLARAEKMYLHHGSGDVHTYPLCKFLMLIDLLSNIELDETYRRTIKNEVLTRINDPLYKKELNAII